MSLHHLGALANDSEFRTWTRQDDGSKPDLRAKNAGGGKLDVIGLVPSVDTAWKPTLSASLSTRQGSQRGPKKGHMTALRSRTGSGTFILHPQQLCFSNFDASNFLPPASRGSVTAISAFEHLYQHLRVHRKSPVAIEPTRRLQDGQ